MKKLFFLLPVLFFIKAFAQEPYDFKKFKENNLSKPGKVMRGITLSDPSGTIILPFDKNMSIDSLQKITDVLQKIREKQHTGTLIFTLLNGTKVYSLPQDHMPCLVPDISQFNMPVFGKGSKITGMPPGLVPPNNIIPEK